jgi:hypothetical protein
MSHELMYTSAARGLRPGEHGFCTVAVTQGIPAALAAKLESLCGYRHLYPPSDRNAELNPVLNSHVRIQVDGRAYHVLSRIADAGLDYSHRTNKFAHHIALDRSELPAAGPAWVLLQPGIMEHDWNDRNPQILPSGRRIPAADSPPRPCRGWKEVMGDGGWAGVLASMTAQGRPAYLIFQPGTDPLPLIAEALALLPASQRWGVTFSTYFLGLPPDVHCQWRCLVADSAEANAVLEANGGNVIVLDGNQGEAPDGPLVEAARTGRIQHEQAAAPSRSARVPVAAPIAAPPLPSNSRRPSAKTPVPSSNLEPAEPAPMSYPESSRPAARSGNVFTLVVGLVLGLILMLFCILPIELLSGRSLPRVAGLEGKEEVALKSELDKVRDELEREKKQSDSLRLELRDVRNALKRATDSRPPDPEPKRDPKSDATSEQPRSDKPAEPEKKPADAEKKPEKSDKPKDDKTPNPSEPATPKTEEKPKKEPEKSAGETSPSGIPKPNLGPAKQGESSSDSSHTIALVIRDPESVGAGKEIPLEIGRASKVELLGLPMKADGNSIMAKSSETSIDVKVGDELVCSIRKNSVMADRWEFVWGPKAGDHDFDSVRAAVHCCVLKVKQMNGEVNYYPLTSDAFTVTLKRMNDGLIYQAELPFQDASEKDAKPSAFKLGQTESLAVESAGIFQLVNENGTLVGNIKKDGTRIELSLSGSVIQLKFGREKMLVPFQPPKFDLYRDIDGKPMKVGVVKCSYGR